MTPNQDSRTVTVSDHPPSCNFTEPQPASPNRHTSPRARAAHLPVAPFGLTWSGPEQCLHRDRQPGGRLCQPGVLAGLVLVRFPLRLVKQLSRHQQVQHLQRVVDRLGLQVPDRGEQRRQRRASGWRRISEADAVIRYRASSASLRSGTSASMPRRASPRPLISATWSRCLTTDGPLPRGAGPLRHRSRSDTRALWGTSGSPRRRRPGPGCGLPGTGRPGAGDAADPAYRRAASPAGFRLNCLAVTIRTIPPLTRRHRVPPALIGQRVAAKTRRRSPVQLRNPQVTDPCRIQADRARGPGRYRAGMELTRALALRHQ